MFLAELHDPTINFNEIDVLHLAMTQAFPGRSAVAAANHQDPINRAGRTEGRMDQGLVIVALLMFGCHPAAIEQEPVSVAIAVDHRDALDRALFVHNHVALESVAHPVVVFVDPVACC